MTTGSDHEVITWEIHDPVPQSNETSSTFTGWSLRKLMDKDKEGEERRAAAKRDWMQAQADRPILDDNSSAADTEREAQWIGEEITDILNRHAKRLRICSRSKRWWNDEISQLRKDLGRTKRAAKNRQATRKQVAAARRLFSRAIRKAKRSMWNNFLQDASDEDV